MARRWDDRLIGAVLGFGAGALISAVSFELVEEGLRAAGGGPVALGLPQGHSPSSLATVSWNGWVVGRVEVPLVCPCYWAPS